MVSVFLLIIYLSFLRSSCRKHASDNLPYNAVLDSLSALSLVVLSDNQH